MASFKSISALSYSLFIAYDNPRLKNVIDSGLIDIALEKSSIEP